MVGAHRDMVTEEVGAQMPNMRAKNLDRIYLWIDRGTKEEFRQLAAAQGQTIMDLVREMIEQACKEAKIEESESKEEVAGEGEG